MEHFGTLFQVFRVPFITKLRKTQSPNLPHPPGLPCGVCIFVTARLASQSMHTAGRPVGNS
jgi:hypothetical protein